MTVTASLYQRRRAPNPDELAGIPWLRVLQPAERDHAIRQLVVTEAEPGEYVCRVGRPVTFWFGVIEGLLKMSAEDSEGRTMTFAGMPRSGWFGEGTALKREPYRYDIQALRKSTIGGVPVDTFHWLLDH